LPSQLDANAFLQATVDVTYPAVVKPTTGAASAGVTRVSSAAELRSAYRPDLEQLVEEYMPDDSDRDQRFASYVSVESATSGGEISHVAISGRFLLVDGFRETGAFIPAALHDGTRERVLELTTAAIRAIGIENAITHIEIKLTPEGPKIIEVNGRIGGPITPILASVSNVNLFRLAAQIAIGEAVHFDRPVECDGVGFVRDINAPLDVARVIEVRGTDKLAELPWTGAVIVQAFTEDQIDLGRTLPVVRVFGRASDHDELVELRDLINDTLAIDYQFAE
jgi:predicted ATP-grasp superfamily ATP-dependent carboligase